MTLFEKIADYVSSWSDKVKAAFSEVDTNDDVELFKAVRAISGVMDEVQELWDKALVAATENRKAEQTAGKKISTEDGGVRDMAWDAATFAKDVDEWQL